MRDSNLNKAIDMLQKEADGCREVVKRLDHGSPVRISYLAYAEAIEFCLAEIRVVADDSPWNRPGHPYSVEMEN